MRSFQQALLFLFALLTLAVAEDTISYDATVYVTSTIYKLNTVTMSGTPTGSVANSTTTISASYVTGVPPPVYTAANSTLAYPTGSLAPSSPAPSTSEFPGAASGLNVNGAIAALVAAGLGFMAL